MVINRNKHQAILISLPLEGRRIFCVCVSERKVEALLQVADSPPPPHGSGACG